MHHLRREQQSCSSQLVQQGPLSTWLGVRRTSDITAGPHTACPATQLARTLSCAPAAAGSSPQYLQQARSLDQVCSSGLDQTAACLLVPTRGMDVDQAALHTCEGQAG
jgi:hypothetical protein